MEPTYHEGDRVYVFKPLMGARICKNSDFENPEMKCIRMPGIRKIRGGDIAVFNYPHGRETGKIGFKLNYVYCKRCLGCPGDTVRIKNGYYEKYSDFIQGQGQLFLSENTDSALAGYGITLKASQYKPAEWTIKDFGPLYIPGKGDSVYVDNTTTQIYRQIIEYETSASCCDGTWHKFRHNWYFFGGDNVMNSKDSRYFGLVPDDYIVGIVVASNR